MGGTYQLVNAHLEGEPFFWEGGEVGVLLSHGYTATSAEVRPLAQVLHTQGYTVAGPLLPGHGTSPEDANRFTWQDWVGAYERLYEKLQQRCKQVVVGGESMGALLALHAAIYHPEAAAVLAYAPGLRTTSLPMRLLAEVLKHRFTALPKRFESPDPLELWQGYAHDPIYAAAQLFRLQTQVNRLLADIRQPLLIVQGKKDKSVYPEVPEWIAAQVSSEVVEVHWMPASGHCVILDEEREQVGQITLNFLEKVLKEA